eukprot:6204731-Pleurochrysis_carterae.AAC.3
MKHSPPDKTAGLLSLRPKGFAVGLKRHWSREKTCSSAALHSYCFEITKTFSHGFRITTEQHQVTKKSQRVTRAMLMHCLNTRIGPSPSPNLRTSRGR